jgi:hypothetical protein
MSTEQQTCRSQPRGGVKRALAFFVAYIGWGELVWWCVDKTGSSQLEEWIIHAGLFEIPLLALIYFFAPWIFAREYWRFPANAWKGISALAILEIVIRFALHPAPVSNRYIVFSALAFAPVIEELARAVMIVPLIDKMGVEWACLVTSILWALFHQYFWVSLVQQLVLCTIFVCSQRSLPANITAHLILNIIAVSSMHSMVLHPI